MPTCNFRIRRLGLVGLLASLAASTAWSAQPDSAAAPASSSSDTDLAKKTQNPISDLISVPFQNNTTFKSGPGEDRGLNALNIQPVIPFGAGDKLNVITRTIFPVISQPWINDDRKNGLGDTLFTSWVSPKDSGPVVWGIGPALSIPTATDKRLGSDYWSMGPSLVLLTMPGKWVVGGLVNNIWSMGDGGKHADGDGVNFFTLQPFVNYNLPKGWYLVSAPIITSNWKQRDGNKWTVPVGFGFGKILRIGKLPINAQTQGFYNAVRPDGIGKWQLRMQIQLLFPK